MLISEKDISADPEKTKAMKEKEMQQSAEDVYSLLEFVPCGKFVKQLHKAKADLEEEKKLPAL